MFQQRLNKLLWSISSISKVFWNIVPRNRTKKSRRFLWKNNLFGFLGKKWSFLKQIDSSTILEDKRLILVFLVIISKCLEKFLFITEDHVYIVNFLHKMERNSFRTSLKTTMQVLIWPSPIATRTYSHLPLAKVIFLVEYV